MAGFDHHTFFFAVSIASLITCAACEPPRPYRIPVPPVSNPVIRTPPLAPSPVPPPAETARKPFPQEPKIGEQNLKDKPQPERGPGKETKEPASLPNADESLPVPEPTRPPLADDSSLLAKITPGVTPQRAASLHLTEEGKKLLESGDPAKALARLEKTIVIDSTNPYGYFYLAKAQYRLGRYRESLNFLDIVKFGYVTNRLACRSSCPPGPELPSPRSISKCRSKLSTSRASELRKSDGSRWSLRLQSDSSPSGK